MINIVRMRYIFMGMTELRHIAYLGCYYIAIFGNNNTSFWCFFDEVNKIFSGFEFNYYGNHCESNVYPLGSDSNSGVQSYTLTI